MSIFCKIFPLLHIISWLVGRLVVWSVSQSCWLWMQHTFVFLHICYEILFPSGKFVSKIKQLNPSHVITSCFFTVHPHLCLDLPRFLFTSGVLTKIFFSFLTSPVLAKCLIHLIFLDSITLIAFGYKYKLWSFLLCNFVLPPFIFFPLGPYVLPCTLVYTPSVGVLPLMWEIIHHTHKTARKMIIYWSYSSCF